MNRYLAHFSIAVVGFLFAFQSVSTAYEIPREKSKVKSFYVFGPEGDSMKGKEDSEQTIFIDVPKDTTSDVVIEVYDPDTIGELDGVVGYYPTPEDTETEFSVTGSKHLEKRSFGADTSTDGQWVAFGPYAPSDGDDVGHAYRFTLQAKGLSGDDQNLFSVRIHPNDAESFSRNISFRLLSVQGAKMYFYPEIPAGTRYIVVENYDLDAEGGSSTIRHPSMAKRHDINDSLSGQWTGTKINMTDQGLHRMEYRIIKATQTRANAAVRVKDDKGNYLNIYFRKGTPPAKPAAPPPPPPAACNVFTFDATDSFDPDKQDLTYKWDFGDGTTSTQPVVTHTYKEAGSYKVGLEVRDSSGLLCSAADTYSMVDVNTPPEAACSAPSTSCTGQAVRFDAGGTRDNTPESLVYSWNFGDGSSGEGKTVSHTYTKGGTYNVLLNVDDQSGSKCATDQARCTVKVNSEPTAVAGKDVSLCLPADASYTLTFNGGGSSDPDGDALRYSWDFGDGSTGQGSKLDHTYKKSGTYTAKLSVMDDSGTACNADSDTVRIALNKAPVAMAGKDKYACVGQSISFDAGSSYGETGETLDYAWNFGDGSTASGKTVSHAYDRGGSYPVTLHVDDGLGTSCSSSGDSLKAHINGAPSADLRAVKASCVGDKITFDASGSSDPDGDSLRYVWNFGDGTTTEGGSKVSHAYEKGGDYRVTVSVSDGKGSGCSDDSASVRVSVNTPPVANAGPNAVCCQNKGTEFDGSASSDADGDTLSYHWNLGDGSTKTGETITHAYSKTGDFNVVLTVDDGSGTSCSSAKSGFVANVNTKPVPVIKIRQG